ncbi:MAG: hypothetical protein KGM17_00300 [Sphingomonadales bacterium]|nr:hypothetical protein [Sphingomonadales bacterium]
MNLAELCAALPETRGKPPGLPGRLLGAFRRKSITFCTGVTDERTAVFWFQSHTFTIDLRLPDGAATAVAERQGWIGDTVWDRRKREMSWNVIRSCQARNQWPEPARFRFIGNSVLEFAPSGAYVEDWRRQAGDGPLLGLRLLEGGSRPSAPMHPMVGGLILAGGRMAWACGRPAGPFEVSVATDGRRIDHTTRPDRHGQPLPGGHFEIAGDGTVTLERSDGNGPARLRFAVDACLKRQPCTGETRTTRAAREWLDRERGHLARHAVVIA